MGKTIVTTFSAGAVLWPDFQAILKSTDCLYIRALTFEPAFQTPPPPSFWGLKRPPTPRAYLFPPPLH